MKKFFGLFIAIAIVIQSCGTLAAKLASNTRRLTAGWSGM